MPLHIATQCVVIASVPLHIATQCVVIASVPLCIATLCCYCISGSPHYNVAFACCFIATPHCNIIFYHYNTVSPHCNIHQQLYSQVYIGTYETIPSISPFITDSNCCLRQYCGPSRPFDMTILDNSKREVIHIKRPLMCSSSLCGFCCLQKMEVESPPGTLVGYVKQE